jgi:hypothetical protein
MGKANRSQKRRSHTFKKPRDPYRIRKSNMRELERLIAENERAASSASAAPRPMTMKKLLKSLRRSKTFKVRNFGEQAKSITTTHDNPVTQVKALGRMIQKHADYLLRKRKNAQTNNIKAMLSTVHDNYDMAVIQIQGYLTAKLIEVRTAYVSSGAFEGLPIYKKVEDPYDDIKNLTDVLVRFDRAIQTYAPQIHPAYIIMMRQIVDEMTRVINASRESAGDKKVNNVNALAALFAGL